MKFCCVWAGSASSWIALRQEFSHSIQVEDPETGKCQKNEYRSETRLAEKWVENPVICLEQNNYWIVSLRVPEETSRSAPNICKPSSKQSLLATTSGSHTVASYTASMSRCWVIATLDGVRKWLNLDWAKQQSTTLEVGYERVITWRH
jgi:hypothetical protein